MLFQFTILIVGFFFLLKGADVLVAGASRIAEYFRVSPLVIGLSLVAFGTSAPELAVNISATLSQNGDMILGNIIGSNIVNIALALGIAVMIDRVDVKPATLFKEIPLSFIAVGALFFLGWDSLFNGNEQNIISFSDGLVLLLFFVIFLSYLFQLAKVREVPVDTIETDKPKIKQLMRSTLLLGLGLIGVTIGGKMVVSSATLIGIFLGMSEAMVGLTITSIGTSLPEIVTGIVAVVKKKHGIAVGNIVGSNIFNIFMVLGTTAVVAPFSFSTGLFIDLLVLVGFTALLFVLILRDDALGRKRGFLLVFMYVLYLVFLVYRG